MRSFGNYSWKNNISLSLPSPLLILGELKGISSRDHSVDGRNEPEITKFRRTDK